MSVLNQVFNRDALAGMKETLPAESIDLIITDPPYDVDYGQKSSFLAEMDKARDKQVERDSHFKDSFVDYDAFAIEWFRVLKPDTHCYLFCSDKQVGKWSDAMVKAGFKAPQILVWVKNKTTFDMTFGHKFPENKEFILFFQKGWRKLNGYDVERQLFRSTLYFDSNGDTEYHSCAKPTSLIMFLTKLSSEKGELCLDCFAGSGAHLISFLRTKRTFIGFEISPHYFSVIQKRLKEEKTQTSLEDLYEL